MPSRYFFGPGVGRLLGCFFPLLGVVTLQEIGNEAHGILWTLLDQLLHALHQDWNNCME